MKTALIFPPQWYPSQPYLALPTLKAHLESKGHEVDQFDFNIECYEVFLSREYLTHCVEIVRQRLSAPAYTTDEQEVKTVYRDILADTGFLGSVLNEVEDAKNVMRDEERFFQFDTYKKAYTTLKVAMKLISYAHFPSRLDLDSFFMMGNPEENLSGILSATADTVRNPFIHMYEEHLLEKVNWNDYGLVGISIIHIGQVIPGLTLARLLRKKFKHLHIVIGGSVFNRHADLLDNKQALFEEFFHSAIVSEGEKPLEELVSHLKEGKPLITVPNLIYMEEQKVIHNPKAEALPYEHLVCPTFDQLPLEKYLMPYPVLPYMSSRGCYWGKCTFCTHSFIYDSYYRKENETRVAEELGQLGKKYNTKYFTFSDEAISPNAFNRMSKAILKQGVEMRALGMLKFESGDKETPELFEDIYKAGFLMLFFGLESANDRILKIIDKGCDQDTERSVLKNSSDAGIWNHLYLFFGFPTEEREEAEDTIQFTVENSEVGTGTIHSVGQSIFALEKDSAIYHNPGKFKIDRIIHDPERDMAIVFDFDIDAGMPRDEVMEVYEQFDSVIEDTFPSRTIWNYLSREHFLLYLDHYGKEEILNMAKTTVSP
ncbi:MAG: radical SAM protein [Nitrospinaceae bacterium]|jgi:anaerobic magnesium-protoporphyrin IX monomethyl ester cyclase|nr:radical SAM protein [Nitrospinaceae bacterium]|tara:strand:+ start:2910 stop:4706 length:1797 start_codon:yes stop_codon:yes gene_type:complete